MKHMGVTDPEKRGRDSSKGGKKQVQGGRVQGEEGEEDEGEEEQAY